MLVSALMALAFASNAQAQGTPLQPSAAALLDWAEQAHPQLFPDSPRNQVHQDFLYRYHPSTGNHAGIAGDGVWLLGPVAGHATAPVRVGSASDFPSRPLTLIVPFAAGGPTDHAARLLAEPLAKALGQPVLLSNRLGQDGTLGTAQAAAAPADGYTLLLNTTSLATSSAAYRTLPYRPLQDLAFVGAANESPMVIAVRPSLPATNLPALRTWLAGRAGQARFVHSGYGGMPYACAALLKGAFGVDFAEVAVPGVAPALSALLAGTADLMCIDAASAASYVAAGQIRALAVTGAERATSAPFTGLPTVEESGHPGFRLTVWTGLMAPRQTPPVVLERLNAALRTAAMDPVYQASIRALAATPIEDRRAGSQGFEQFVGSEIERIGAALAALGRYVQ
jgi:tripartite-type tricarboxylate transporter receptor subunit TctC